MLCGSPMWALHCRFRVDIAPTNPMETSFLKGSSLAVEHSALLSLPTWSFQHRLSWTLSFVIRSLHVLFTFTHLCTSIVTVQGGITQVRAQEGTWNLVAAAIVLLHFLYAVLARSFTGHRTCAYKITPKYSHLLETAPPPMRHPASPKHHINHDQADELDSVEKAGHTIKEMAHQKWVFRSNACAGELISKPLPFSSIVPGSSTIRSSAWASCLKEDQLRKSSAMPYLISTWATLMPKSLMLLQVIPVTHVQPEEDGDSFTWRLHFDFLSVATHKNVD